MYGKCTVGTKTFPWGTPAPISLLYQHNQLLERDVNKSTRCFAKTVSFYQKRSVTRSITERNVIALGNHVVVVVVVVWWSCAQETSFVFRIVLSRFSKHNFSKSFDLARSNDNCKILYLVGHKTKPVIFQESGTSCSSNKITQLCICLRGSRLWIPQRLGRSQLFSGTWIVDVVVSLLGHQLGLLAVAISDLYLVLFLCCSKASDCKALGQDPRMELPNLITVALFIAGSS